jgi:hypothetical protein
MRYLTKPINILGIFYVSIGNGSAADKVSVFVSIAPQKFFVQQIGADLVESVNTGKSTTNIMALTPTSGCRRFW